MCRTCGSMSNAELNQEFHWMLQCQLPNTVMDQMLLRVIVIVTATNIMTAVMISIFYAQPVGLIHSTNASDII